MMIHDFYDYFIKKRKFILCYIVITLLFILFENMMGVSSDTLITSALGLNYSLNTYILDIIMYIMNIGFTILSVVIIFSNDFNEGIENIFLRMNKKKWLCLKLLNIILIIFFTKVLLFFIIMILCVIKGIVIKRMIEYFCVTLFIHIFISLLSIFLLLLSVTNKYLIFLIITICIINVRRLFINFLNLKISIILSAIILLFVLIMVFNHKVYYFFEEGRK